MDEQKKTVLVVDDERSEIRIMADTLQKKYRVLIAKNGKEALKRAVSHPLPDIILLDIVMPEMNGFEVFKKLKKFNFKNIEIIIY